MPEDLVPRLTLSATAQAQEDVRNAAAWLSENGGDVERFLSVFAETVTNLSGDISERLASGIGLPPVNQDASEAFGMEVRVQVMQTGKRRARRSPAGLWRMLYVLLSTAEENAEDAVDTLLIVGFRHAAARPFGEAGTDE